MNLEMDFATEALAQRKRNQSTRFGTRFAVLNAESASGERLVPLSGIVEVLPNPLAARVFLIGLRN